ncbi:GMC oxidoreductase-domain-containing protein [Mycena leptocephala]|nr:GMC oxidoreductase-domain-containing protein [Mycena leptocephala]
MYKEPLMGRSLLTPTSPQYRWTFQPRGWGQATAQNGSRSSSATSYLGPQFAAYPNLHVLLHTRVTRVLPTTSNGFRTVEFPSHVASGQRFNLTANEEIILSAGTFGTPNILPHSGIGNSSTLNSVGVKPMHNLPSVGQNLSDHSLTFLSFLVNSTDTFEAAECNATLATEELARWQTTQTGPFIDPPSSHTGSQYHTLRTNLLKWIGGSPSSHRKLPQYNPRCGFSCLSYVLLIIYIYLSDPTCFSGSSVTINSTDPLATPLIKPKLLSSEVALLVMHEALKSALHFVTAPAWKNYSISPVGVSSTSTDAKWMLSSLACPQKVRDEVLGLTGLQIVDLSVVPFIPAAHTQAATYIIAERASDIIEAFTFLVLYNNRKE